VNSEDVKKIAREVADKDKVDPVNSQGDMITLFPEELMRLIDRVQAQEREACAKLVEEFDLPFIAGAIRSRGEVK
jgi:hypothetical protein